MDAPRWKVRLRWWVSAGTPPDEQAGVSGASSPGRERGLACTGADVRPWFAPPHAHSRVRLGLMTCVDLDVVTLLVETRTPGAGPARPDQPLGTQELEARNTPASLGTAFVGCRWVAGAVADGRPSPSRARVHCTDPVIGSMAVSVPDASDGSKGLLRSRPGPASTRSVPSIASLWPSVAPSIDQRTSPVRGASADTFEPSLT